MLVEVKERGRVKFFGWTSEEKKDKKKKIQKNSFVLIGQRGLAKSRVGLPLRDQITASKILIINPPTGLAGTAELLTYRRDHATLLMSVDIIQNNTLLVWYVHAH